ncbi:unnamed protein product [Urochloa decumbens]|uniref:BHLH domain-containing protein n=1 Tax=Urochloa decumbens TaxID=240449 RepID=A0ABC9CSN9_9POAL
MGDHAEMLHAAPAVVYSSAAATHGGWWNAAAAVPAPTCSTELAGFGGSWSSALAASYDLAAEGGKAKSATTASSESPGNNSSVTFQEPTGVADPVGIGAAVHQQQPLAGGYTDWTHPYMNSGATLHGFLQDGHQDMSSRTDQSPMAASSLMNPNPSTNNLALQLQGHQEQDHHQQLLSSFGSELLLSPTSPYGLQSSLLRSLMEPVATNKTALPGFQQYDQYGQQVSPAAARFAPGAISREPLQFTNDAPFWSSSAAGFGMPAAAAPPNQASVRSVKPSPAPRAATLALKTALEGVGESSSITTKKKANGEPAFKKPRLETPSPLPTFKVRKEKLGDRVTALQQLVAPFGKTDTASVLHETIEYIKFLHDQVGVSARREYHDSPPFNHSTSEASTNSHVFFIRIIRSSEHMTDRSSELHLTLCLRLVSLQVLSAPYLKNGHHHQVPHLKVHTVTVHICRMLAPPFHCDGSWYLLNDLFKCADRFACVRASRFRAQVPRNPRTVMARYHSRAGGCAWSRYPARSRWPARCPSTSGLRLAPTLGRRKHSSGQKRR